MPWRPVLLPRERTAHLSSTLKTLSWRAAWAGGTDRGRLIAFSESSKRMPKAAAAADDRVGQGSFWRKRSVSVPLRAVSQL